MPKKRNIKGESIPKTFVKKYIYFYYAIFWLIIIIFLFLKD